MDNQFEIESSSMRLVLDSRGNRTVEATIRLKGGASGTCAAPSGASTGATEVRSFRNSSPEESVKYFNSTVRKAIEGFHGLNQAGFDDLLKQIDGTGDFSAMGGNASTALSIALAKAVSSQAGIPLYRYAGGSVRGRMPKPLGNVIGGGKHAINGTTIQEFFISNDARSFLKAMEFNVAVHKRIGQLARDIFKDTSIGVGDEKAWTLSIDDTKAMEMLKQASKEVSHEMKVNPILGLDAAASSFFENGKYVYRDHKKTRDEQIDFIIQSHKDFGISVIEDPMNEDDFEGHSVITKAIGDKSLIVGDDLYTTNAARIREGIKLKATNAVLIKVNQIGTLTDTWDAVRTATEASMRNVISHRSGETEDAFLAHLSIAFSSDYIKSGAIGGERLVKLNELVRIQEDIS